MHTQLEMTKQSSLDSHQQKREHVFDDRLFKCFGTSEREMITIRLITLIINDGYYSVFSLKQKNEATHKPAAMQSDSACSQLCPLLGEILHR